MSNHDDFVDDYIEYRIFEESMKRSGGGKPPKRNSGCCGCSTWAILIVVILIVLGMLGACGKSSKSTCSGSYRSNNNNYSVERLTFIHLNLKTNLLNFSRKTKSDGKVLNGIINCSII